MSETLLAFAAASLVLVVVPGPNVVYIVARGLAQGRAAGWVGRLVRRRPRRRYAEAAVYAGLGVAVATTGSPDR